MDPRQIAKYITDDPDIFNEMAVTSASFPSVTTGLQRSRKKKKKKKKKKNIDKSSLSRIGPNGQPKDAGDEVLFSDIPTENPEQPLKEASGKKKSNEEIDEDERRKKWIPQFASIKNDLNIQGEYLSGENKILFDGALKKGLRNARTRVERLYIQMNSYVEVFPGTKNDCSLLSGFHKALEKIEELKKKKNLEPEYKQPPKWWWGVDNWDTTKGRKYYWDIFLSEVCVRYLNKASDLWDQHELTCFRECFRENHESFYIELFCGRSVGDGSSDGSGEDRLNFWEEWKTHFENRKEAIKNFSHTAPGKKGKKKRRTAPKLTPEEQARYDAYKAMSPEEQSEYRGRVSQNEMFPSGIQHLRNWGNDAPESELDRSRRSGVIDNYQEMYVGDRAFWVDEAKNVVVIKNSGEYDDQVHVVDENDWEPGRKNEVPHETSEKRYLVYKSELQKG